MGKSSPIGRYECQGNCERLRVLDELPHSGDSNKDRPGLWLLAKWELTPSEVVIRWDELERQALQLIRIAICVKN